MSRDLRYGGRKRQFHSAFTPHTTYGEGINYLHFHNYMEIGLCHFGEGEMILDDTAFHFSGGSIVIVPPNIPHTTNSRPGTKSSWSWMYFDLATILCEMFLQDSLSVEKMKNRIFSRPLFFSEKEQPAVSSILHQIAGEMDERKYLYRECVKGLLRAFIVEILRIKNEERTNREKQKTILIAPAIDYIEKHYREKVKILDMALACNISESHFRKIFEDLMNMKPNDYLNLVRIQKSCDLLKKTDHSMEEISVQAGFENVSTFNRNFKKLLGETPYHWKRSADNYEGKLLNYKISVLRGW